jgi:ribosomal protein L37AE/L43A
MSSPYDAIAARYLLAGVPIPRHLVRKAAQASGEECPECGCRDTESNGSSEWRCVECDHRWGFEYGEPYGF